MARQLAGTAQSLVLVARRKERLMKLAAQCQADNPDLTVLIKAFDLSLTESIEQLLAELQADGITVTALINNAGLGQIGLFEECNPAQLQQMLMVNVVALCTLTRALLPGIIETKGGILNVSSGFGLTWMPFFSAYVGTKHFVSGFNSSLRAELSGTGVIVSQLCPGPVATEFESVAGDPLRGISTVLD